MAGNYWMRIDMVENPPSYLVPDDVCYYARDYTTEGGFSASVANNLINNFKKEKRTQGTLEWKYKEGAVTQLAREISITLPDGATVCSIPPSKSRDDPDFDPRYDMLFAQVLKGGRKIVVEEPVVCIASTGKAHKGEISRDPNDIITNYQWDGFKGPVPEVLYVIDDVISSGGHFRAFQALVHKHYPTIEIVGLFFGKTVRVQNVPEEREKEE
ncbi:hypothetical protein ACFLUP_03430 [Chloroflexota bacterium]